MDFFDKKAQLWDSDPIHWERSEAIAKKLIQTLPLTPDMKAMEYGAGTGILSFLLSDQFAEITLMDSSLEMVKLAQEKIQKNESTNLSALLFDLEKEDYQEKDFNCIFTQMVMHHVHDLESVFKRFNTSLKPNGYLAIADLYIEDGSFHGEGFDGHNGFDPAELKQMLGKVGFTEINYEPCFIVKRTKEDKIREYPVFLLTARKVQ